MEQKIVSTFTDLIRGFPDDESCRVYLELVVGVRCPYCYEKEKWKKLEKDGNFMGYKCDECKKKFNNFTGTEFERSHIPFRKTLIAIFLFIRDKKINTHQFAKDMGITQKSAWNLFDKIRRAKYVGYREEMVKKRKKQYKIEGDSYEPKRK